MKKYLREISNFFTRKNDISSVIQNDDYTSYHREFIVVLIKPKSENKY